MRRTLAITLAAAVLLTGGCARNRPAAGEPASVAPAATTTAPAAPETTAPKPAADVDGLLDEVDKQLAGDASPTEDQD